MPIPRHASCQFNDRDADVIMSSVDEEDMIMSSVDEEENVKGAAESAPIDGELRESESEQEIVRQTEVPTRRLSIRLKPLPAATLYEGGSPTRVRSTRSKPLPVVTARAAEKIPEVDGPLPQTKVERQRKRRRITSSPEEESDSVIDLTMIDDTRSPALYAGSELHASLWEPSTFLDDVISPHLLYPKNVSSFLAGGGERQGF